MSAMALAEMADVSDSSAEGISRRAVEGTSEKRQQRKAWRSQQLWHAIWKTSMAERRSLKLSKIR